MFHCFRSLLGHFLVRIDFDEFVVFFVEFFTFFLLPHIGVAPPSFLAIQAGKTLNTLTSSREAFSWLSMVYLTIFACITMLPVFFKKYFKTKIE